MPVELARVLERPEVGAFLGMLNLAQGVVQIPVQEDDRTHLVHRPAALGALDDTAAAAHEQGLALAERLERRGLVTPKGLLTLALKDLGHRHALKALNQPVGVDVIAAEEAAEVACQGRLARAEEAHEEDVVAALVHDVAALSARRPGHRPSSPSKVWPLSRKCSTARKA